MSERVHIVNATRYVTQIGEFAETWGSNRVKVDTKLPSARERDSGMQAGHCTLLAE